MAAAAILAALSLVLGVVSYVALPALLDGILGDDDRPQETWTLCRRPPPDVRGPDGSGSLWLSDHGCG